MPDDDVNAMIQVMKDCGVREKQITRVLEFLGEAEEINAELEARLLSFQRREVQKTLAAAMLKIFKWGE